MTVEEVAFHLTMMGLAHLFLDKIREETHKYDI